MKDKPNISQTEEGRKGSLISVMYMFWVCMLYAWHCVVTHFYFPQSSNKPSMFFTLCYACSSLLM